MADQRILLGDIVSGMETDALDEDLKVRSVFCLIKSESGGGATVWSGRSAGEALSSEELLGALEGLVESLRRDLAADWEW